MGNFISQNIKHLCETNFLRQNEFGEIFGLKKSVISTYVSDRATPKLETIQQICAYFEVSIDDFINHDLRDVAKEKKKIADESYVAETGIEYDKDIDQKALSDVIDLLAKKALRKIQPTLTKQQKQIDELSAKIDLFDKKI